MAGEISENRQRMLRGELFYAYEPEMVQARQRCTSACNRFNEARNPTRRQRVVLLRDILEDRRPLPPELPDPAADAAQFDSEPWVEPPIRMDYGTNVRLGADLVLNWNCTIIDPQLVSVGARTLVGPSVSFYGGSHPLDPAIRNGKDGPEGGKEIHVGEDCWIGGQAVILPGVRIGRGCTVGAASVVTKDVPAFHVVAGNPARIIRKIHTALDPEQQGQPEEPPSDKEGAEKPMSELARAIEDGA